MVRFKNITCIAVLFILSSHILGLAADWPMWRYDAGRTACGPEELSQELHPLWIRQYSEREMVWDDPLNQDLMQFDKFFEPIVLGNTLYIGFNDRDKVVALDIKTGAEKWVFYVDGPVRLPLAGWQNRLFFISDDGYLYCLSAENGKMLWKFRGGPGDRKILGNKRLISTWPARGGVVIYDGIVYFAASIWPFMGTFIYAIDAATGSIVWQNEGTGAEYMNQPHNSPAFAGVAPQGAFVVSGDQLLIPGGRSVPACFDRNNGKSRYYHLAKYNKTGGAFVCANQDYFFNHFRDRDTELYDLKTGEIVRRQLGKYPVISGDIFYMSGDSIIVRHAKNPKQIQTVLNVDASGDLIRSGSRLYAGGNGVLTAIQILDNGELKVVWTQKIEGKIGRLLAANGQLFAVTQDEKIIAFGAENIPVQTINEKNKSWQPSLKNIKLARNLLEQARIKDGYALFYGIGDGELLTALAQNSNLNLIAVDSDAAKIDKYRPHFDDLGLLGIRIHLLQGTPADFPAPPYMASLTIINNLNVKQATDNLLKKLIISVRPYGGKLWLPFSSAQQKTVAVLIKKLNDPMLSVQNLYNGLMVSRDGPLPGASNWTHQYGDMANTVKSDDELVKLPLGILWFGGSSNVDVLPRHGHGPPEQVVDGRLIIEGMDGLSARDVYTGRVLWKRKLDSLDTFGQYYDESYTDTPLLATYNQEHIPGANVRGTNFVATSDFVYVIQGNQCLALDMQNGETKKIFTLPQDDASVQTEWGYIGVMNDNLIAGQGFVPFSVAFPSDISDPEKVKKMKEKDIRKLKSFGNYDFTASQSLIIMDRHNGSVKWKVDSRYGFMHNAIAATNEKIFCLDKLPPALEKKLVRRGLPIPLNYRLLAMDLKTGKVLWEKSTGVFGSWLGYSQEFNRLLQATRPSRDMVIDEEGERMAVYNATTGELIWDREIEYENPPILHHDYIITDNAAYSLATGEQKLREDPLTGEKIPWTYSRTYGCNYNIASEYLLSFRSAAAGFYDLYSEGGTGNFGGFKSGCTSNLIAAGGVLNAPDYTRTCQCSYQNQTSLALIHTPEMEYWTTNDFNWNGKSIRKIGINLNAPGDRIAPDGTLWLDFPGVGGKSPDILIKYDSLQTRGIRKHSLSMNPGGYEWVTASGLSGQLNFEINLTGTPVEETYYTVKLHFAEIENKKPGERVFNVSLQDNEVLKGFDIVREAGSVNKSIIKTFTSIPVKNVLKIQCTPVNQDVKALPLLCGIEVVKEGN
ncbi:PQQ-binding-like beta-propeller repeat protein [candidate division KSB1 bacterium]|nr:PQQ-binding-like beta-propeller repeat protein [candidate division KSB1 bacterium]